LIDKKSIDPDANYRYMMFNTYIDATSVIAISSSISNKTVIGSMTTIDSGCEI